MSHKDSLKMNPFWVASSDEEEDDEDENNNNGSAETVSRPKSQEVSNPLQHIAFAYAYGSSDDEY